MDSQPKKSTVVVPTTEADRQSMWDRATVIMEAMRTIPDPESSSHEVTAMSLALSEYIKRALRFSDEVNATGLIHERILRAIDNVVHELHEQRIRKQ